MDTLNSPLTLHAPPHVLMADDDSSILFLLSRLLQRNGYSVVTTTNGDEVVSLIEQRRPDIILLDVHMGHVDGSELCKKLKQIDSIKDIPVLLVSSDSNLEQIAWICAADGHLAKPIRSAQLLARIKEIIAGK